MANWRSNPKTVHLFGPTMGDSRHVGTIKLLEGVSRGLDVKWRTFLLLVLCLLTGCGWRPNKPLKIGKLCTVSGWEGQFAKWCLSHAPTCRPFDPQGASARTAHEAANSDANKHHVLTALAEPSSRTGLLDKGQFLSQNPP